MKKIIMLCCAFMLYLCPSNAQSLSVTASPTTVASGADITFTVSGETALDYYIVSLTVNRLDSKMPYSIAVNPASLISLGPPYKFKSQAGFTVPSSTSENVTFAFDAQVYSKAANGYVNVRLTSTVSVTPPPPQVITYYNAARSVPFMKNDCPSGSAGSEVLYSVPANKYSSKVSQQDADAKAQTDVNANGQAYANTTGQCITCTVPTIPVILSADGFTENKNSYISVQPQPGVTKYVWSVTNGLVLNGQGGTRIAVQFERASATDSSISYSVKAVNACGQESPLLTVKRKLVKEGSGGGPGGIKPPK